MLDTIRALLTGQPVPDAAGTAHPADTDVDPVHVAACALLLDIAWADGEFSAPEREHLNGVLARHFGLGPDDAAELLAIAEQARRNAVDHFRFTSLLRSEYDAGQKLVLAEVMWGLALADGQVAEHEHYLTRKIANLLELEPSYLSSAKASAEARRRHPPGDPPPTD